MEAKSVNPLVSVIIPTFSRPDNLTRAIDSVLNQTYSPIEIIIVDDNGRGSQNQLETEATLEDYIKENKIVYIKHENNLNGSAARNTGLRYSHGNYINFVDDDDELSPEKIEKQVNKLSNFLDYDATYCDTKVIIKKRVTDIVTPEITEKVEDILSGKVFFNTTTVLFRRTAIEELNGFIDSFIRHQDYELYLRYFRHHKMIKTEYVNIIKYEGNNIVSSNPEKRESLLRYFLEYFNNDLQQMIAYDEIIGYQYFVCAVCYLESRMYKNAWRCLNKSNSHKPLSIYSGLKYLYHLVRSVIKKGK